MDPTSAVVVYAMEFAGDGTIVDDSYNEVEDADSDEEDSFSDAASVNLTFASIEGSGVTPMEADNFNSELAEDFLAMNDVRVLLGESWQNNLQKDLAKI